MRTLPAGALIAILFAGNLVTLLAETPTGDPVPTGGDDSVLQQEHPSVAPDSNWTETAEAFPHSGWLGHGIGSVPTNRFAGCCDAYDDPRGFKYQWAPDRWAKVGAAIRTSFNSFTPSSAGTSGSYFNLDNVRLLTSGQVTDYIGFELNSDVSLTQGVSQPALAVPSSYDVLDAIMKVETGDVFNFWIGQFLPPSDRSNIDGPFFINGWDFPFVSNYPAVIQGRQMGAAYWGQWAGGQVKWSVGAFNGTGGTVLSPYTTPPDNPPNPNGNIQFDARVTVNFFDPEPGYYHQSSYYGKKNIFAIGYAVQGQKDATGTADNPASFLGMSVDALFERTLPNDGVITLEGTMYRYNDGNLTTSSRQGEAGYIYAGYIIPYDCRIGPLNGRWRPFVRYQQYNRDFQAASIGLYSRGTDLGVEYTMNGPNARLTAEWSNRDVIGSSQIQIFRLGAQVIF